MGRTLHRRDLPGATVASRALVTLDSVRMHITEDAVTCALNLRSHHPVLFDAGFAALEIPILWWDGRTLRFRFPPR